MKTDSPTEPETTPAGGVDSGGCAPMAGSAFWVLFEHMSQNHGLTLLDSELSDICHAVDAMRKNGNSTS